MQRVTRIVAAIDRISMLSGMILAWWTVVAVFVITFEVVARYVFDRPTNWAHESMTLIFAMQYILCGAYAHWARAHVRVDVVFQALSPRQQAWMNVLTSMLFFFYIGIMTYTGWFFYWDSQTMWEVSFTDWAPPMYPVKFTVFLGCLLLLFQGLANLARDLHFAATGSELA
jgi:TRAP-type mannitol/chloroaromatic compound transport system permease small subunit